jgi:hypothetical protein
MRTHILMLLSALSLASLTGCAADTDASVDESEESELTAASAKSLFAALDEGNATPSQIAKALQGGWSETTGSRPIQIIFGKPKKVGNKVSLPFSYDMVLSDIVQMERGYGVATVKGMFSPAMYAALHALTPAKVAAAGGAVTTQGFYALQVKGTAEIDGSSIPLGGYRVKFNPVASVPEAFRIELLESGLSFDTYSAFDHKMTPCLRSHVDLGGVMCDQSGPEVTVRGNGIVGLWFTTGGGAPANRSGVSHHYERKAF